MSQLSSDVNVTQGSSSVPNITQQEGHVVNIVGVSQRGPVGVATLVQSWAEFERLFGWFTTTADGTLAVWNFFQETGGTGTVYFTRVVHYATGVKTSAAATITLPTVAVGTTTQDTLKVDGYSDGTYANDLGPGIADATNGNAEYFNLGIYQGGVLIDTIPNCTMDSTNTTNYVETLVTEWNKTHHQLITVTDLDATGSATVRRPANTSVPPTEMTTGDDGLTSIADVDYVGTTTLANGIYACGTIEAPTLILVPGRATSTVANALVTYCELTRGKKLFAILDTPSGNTKTQAVTYTKTTAALKNLTQQAAIFWPWPRIDNPDQTVFGTAKTITVSPTGLVAGLFARVATATKKGFAENPAGVSYPFYSVRGFEGEDDDRKTQHAVCAGLTGKDTRDYVFPERINPLRKDESSPFYLDGEYTLKAGNTGSWSTTGKQLAGQAIMRALETGLQVVRHRNHNQQLEDECRDGCYAYLEGLTANEYFASLNPKEAFAVDFGPGQNTANSKAAFKINGQIGVALSDPAIFVNVVVNPLSTQLVSVA